MYTPFLCPDCGDEHGQPADATLGHHLRCLDCALEVELAIEIRSIVISLAA